MISILVLDFRTLKLEILELDDKCLTGMDHGIHGSITSTGTVRVIVTVFTN